MTMLHQESNAVLFRLNGEWFGNVDRLNAAHVEFIAAGGAFILSKLAGCDQGGFLSQTGRDRKLLVTDCLLAHDRLHVTGPVANSQKMQLAAVTAASQPSAERHFLSHMLRCGINRYHRH